MNAEETTRRRSTPQPGVQLGQPAAGIPHYTDGPVTIWHGDCIDVMRGMPDNSVDAAVTDPPYNLTAGKKGGRGEASVNLDSPYDRARITTGGGGFMGKGWDDYDSYTREDGSPGSFQHWCEDWAREAYRLLKPGGHLLAFGGTRTFHRLTAGIEDAGFEIRDSIAWLYGSGFPKSLDVSKAIDKMRDDRDHILAITTAMADAADRLGITRGDVDAHMGTSDMGGWWLSRLRHRCQCPKWDQWLQLKTLLDLGDEHDAEVWRLNGRKGTPGDNWDLREIVGARDVPAGHAFAGSTYGGDSSNRTVDVTAPATADAARWNGWGTALKPSFEPVVVARKPLAGTVASNVLRFGTGALNIDATRVEGRERTDYGLAHATRSKGATYGTPTPSADFDSSKGRWPANVVLDGSQKFDEARYFYTAKAPGHERPSVDGVAHPTVKPVDLMRWLVKLVTPPGGVVLEPFAGSGTTVEAAVLEGFHCIAIEREADYLPLILQRIRKPHAVGLDFGEWEA